MAGIDCTHGIIQAVLFEPRALETDSLILISCLELIVIEKEPF